MIGATKNLLFTLLTELALDHLWWLMLIEMHSNKGNTYGSYNFFPFFFIFAAPLSPDFEQHRRGTQLHNNIPNANEHHGSLYEPEMRIQLTHIQKTVS